MIKLVETNQVLIQNRTIFVIRKDGREGVMLSEGQNNGIAWLNTININNAVIEIDLKGRNIAQQSFLGIAFHGIDEKTFDAVYFRPFNFQALDSVRKIHSVQYISLPSYDWQRLREEKNAKFEAAVLPAPKPDEWFHAKIVLRYPVIEVYLNGNKKASLVVTQLNDRRSGKFGLWVGNNSDGRFANLTIQKH